MSRRDMFGKLALVVVSLGATLSIFPQGKPADYERARNLRAQTQGLVYDSPDRPTWIEKTHRFWYRKSVKGGNMFMIVDADSLGKRTAFDHDKLAAALSTVSGQKYTGAFAGALMHPTFLCKKSELRYA